MQATSNYYQEQWTHDKGINYYKNFYWTEVFYRQEKAFRDYLNRLNDPKSVLELGIGFGRITKILLEKFDPTKYVGIDISPDQIKNAKSFLGNKNWQSVAFVEDDVVTYEDVNKYDLVLASEILLHIKPEHIKGVIEKMVKNWAKRDIIHIDWARDYEPSNWCFVHDYYKLFTDAGAMQINEIRTDSQSIWHWRVI